MALVKKKKQLGCCSGLAAEWSWNPPSAEENKPELECSPRPRRRLSQDDFALGTEKKSGGFDELSCFQTQVKRGALTTGKTGWPQRIARGGWK